MSNEIAPSNARKRPRVEVKGYDKEVIIQILKTMMRCASGVDTHLFSYGPFDDEDNRSFNCHLCWTTNLFGLNDIRAHLKSERHCKNLKRIPALTHFKLPLAVSYKKREGKDKKYFKIFAGENIEVPDYQMEQCFISEFQWFLTIVDETIVKILSEDPLNDSGKLKTIFGINFLGKMASVTGQLRYFCFLCEENLKIEENEGHFRSTSHEFNYIKQFFPLSYAKVLDLFDFLDGEDQKRAAICDFFRKLYGEIESEHGLQSITVVSENDQNNNFIRLQSKMWSLDHYGELYSEFCEKRVAAYVQKLFESPESYKEIKPPANFYADVNFLKGEDQVSVSQPPPAKRVHTDDIKSFITNYELQKFKDKEVEAIKTRFNSYENDPKSYRLYSEEWNKFYQVRRAELQKQGTNLTTYNFQKDFKNYWKKRCEELMNIAIKEKLADIDSGACRPPPKPENTKPPAQPIVPQSQNNPVRTVTSKRPVAFTAPVPPPPLWKHNTQQAQCVIAPKPVPPPVVANIRPIRSIPQLLLAIETFMTSLGPGILQLINNANNFKQGNDSSNIGKYVVLCRQIEATLAGHLADAKKLQIFRHAVKNLNALVDPENATGSSASISGTMETLAQQKQPQQIQSGGSGNHANIKNGTNDSDNSYKKPAVTSLRQTTNPIFDFEIKTYGEVQVKTEDIETNDVEDENLSNSSRRSGYKSETQSPMRNLSPASNYSYKSDYGEKNANNQVNAQYTDRGENLQNRNSGSLLGGQNIAFGNRFGNLSQNLNRNPNIWAVNSNRNNY